MSDTYHEILAEAMKQAEWEFEISFKEWIDL
jgi:hypothetical protein